MRLSIILPVHSETNTVRDITEALLNLLGGDVYEIILVVSSASPEETFKICHSLSEKYSKVEICIQTSNGLGNAIRDGFSRVSGSHVLMMDSDGEMNPQTVPKMVRKLLDENLDMVVASRWMKGGGSIGYTAPKYVFNRFYNRLFRFLFGTNIHDLSLGFKIMRIEAAKGIRWEGVRHEIATETTLRPICIGYKVGEVPTVWVRRMTGKSKNWMFANVRYIRMAVRIWRTQKKV
ncbi:MAG: glycosyltransferase family 2 protein [Candidatus Bathyarchaeota archaeon]